MVGVNRGVECLLLVWVLWVIRGGVIAVSCVRNWLVGVRGCYLVSGVWCGGESPGM